MSPTSLKNNPAPSPPTLKRAWRGMIGLAKDFWKDGKEPILNFNHKRATPFDLSDLQAYESSAEAATARARYGDDPRAACYDGSGLWQAMPGEVDEKMWGRDFVCPCDDGIGSRLTEPLNLNAGMTLLDLSAGLGGRLRQAVAATGVYGTGMESDHLLAQRGMALSLADKQGSRAAIMPYDPAHLTPSHRYDAAMFRETVYRVADRAAFARAVVNCLKPKAQVSFTDYIVNPESRDQPAILAWRACEPDANPPGLVEMAEIWARAGVDLRSHEDVTGFYKKEVTAGLQRLAKYMATGVKPDAHTKHVINQRITLWAHRVAAMEQGMQVYRFYGVR